MNSNYFSFVSFVPFFVHFVFNGLTITGVADYEI